MDSKDYLKRLGMLGWTNTGWLPQEATRTLPERHIMYYGPYVLRINKLDADVAPDHKRYQWTVERTGPGSQRYVRKGYESALGTAQDAAQNHVDWHLRQDGTS